MKLKILYIIITVLLIINIISGIEKFSIKQKIENIIIEYEKILLQSEVIKESQLKVIKINYKFEGNIFAKECLLTKDFRDIIDISLISNDKTYFIFLPQKICTSCIEMIAKSITDIKPPIHLYIICNTEELRSVRNLIPESTNVNLLAIQKIKDINNEIKHLNIPCIFRLDKTLKMRNYSIIDKDQITLFDAYLKNQQFK